MGEEPLCEVGDDPGEVFQVEFDACERAGPVEVGRGRPCRIELVQMPAEPADHAGPFSDEVLAVVDQEADLAFGAVETGGGQIGFSQGGTCNRESVDRVDLPNVRALSRTWDISLGGTRTTCSPATRRSRSNRLLRCRQSSIAQSRS